MIGIFGGTFDPIHYGHLRAALESKEIFRLDEVRLIPSSQPPHRGQPSATAEQRLAMLKLGVADQPGFTIDSQEIDRPGKSFMVDTLHALRAEFPEKSLLLFIGSDAFHKLNTWHRWQNLFDYAHVIVLTRPGFALSRSAKFDDFFADKIIEVPQSLLARLNGNLYFQVITQLDISATSIRAMIAQGHSPRYLLPDAVLQYIKAHKLYQSRQ